MSSDSGSRDLPALREKLAALTGGAPPRAVLAELAQSLAADLATHFDELPMHQFTGFARRTDWLAFLLPRSVKHRVLMGRYLLSSTPRDVSETIRMAHVRIAVIGLGSDGGLRRGVWSGSVRLLKNRTMSIDALRWDDLHLRNVPSHAIVMREWGGTTNPLDVASPAELIETLNAIASGLADETNKDLELLNRLLGR